jgi:hypothetical protein
MAGRLLTIPIPSVAIGTAVQDIFSSKAGAAIGLILHAIHLDSTNAAAGPLYIRLKNASATITLGSGGTVITPPPTDKSNAFSVTGVYHINDTTQATTSGAFVNLEYFIWDTVLPFDYLPPPEHRLEVAGAQGFFLDLPAVIVAATIAGYVIIEES